MRFYVDTCIWIDFYENRFSKSGSPIGKYASELFMKLSKKKATILFSDLTIKEMKKLFREGEVESLLGVVSLLFVLEKAKIINSDYEESVNLALERNVPRPDALHAILARNNDAVLVTRDAHFQKLRDIVRVIKPEEF